MKQMNHSFRPNRPSIVSRMKHDLGEQAQAGSTEFLARSAVSRLLGVSPNTVTRWAREGRLACQVTLGGHHRFERTVVEQLRKSLTRGEPGGHARSEPTGASATRAPPQAPAEAAPSRRRAARLFTARARG
jgi:excisionase family DNA binding protein